MRKLLTIVFLFGVVVGVMGAEVGDWRTSGSGDWDNYTIWEICTVAGDPGTWVAAGVGEYPFAGEIVLYNTVTIQSGDDVDASLIPEGYLYGGSGGHLFVESGATLILGDVVFLGELGTNTSQFETVTINGGITTNSYFNTLTLNIGSTGILNTSYNSSFGFWGGDGEYPTTTNITGTIEYSRAGNQVIGGSTDDFPYGNLTLSGSGTKQILTNNGISIGGTLTIENGVTFSLGESIKVGGTSISNDGTLTMSGTYEILFNATASPVISGTGVFSNLYSIRIGILPTRTSNVTFNTSSEIDVDNLIVARGSITITPTAKVTVNNSLQYATGIEVIIQSNSSSTGSLIAPSISGGGDLECQRYITGSRWHMLSSPVSDQPINTFLSANSIDQSPNVSPTMWALADYNETTNLWNTPVSIGGEPATPFTVGKGYISGIGSSGTVSFTGTPNVGNKTTSLTASGLAWNAVGNPYTSSLDVASLISTNTALLNSSYQSIYVYNGTNYAPVTSGYVQPGQGFFVKAASAGSLSFTTTMQSHQNPTFYKKSLENNEYAEINLLAASNGITDEAIIRLYPDETYGLDPGKDIGKFTGGGVNFLLYSQLLEDNGVEFAIQALPEDSIEKISIPIGLNYKKGGSVTFSAEIVDLPAGTRVILEDRLLEEYTDLENASASYTVELPAETDGYGRFYLHTYDPNAVGTGMSELKNFSIFAKNKVLYINGRIDKSGQASVYNLLGKELKQAELVNGNTNTINLSELNEGIYIIRIMNGNNIYSEKVFLR